MSVPWQFPPPGSFAEPRLDHRRFVDRRCPQLSTGRIRTTCAVADAASIRFRIPVDRARAPAQVPGCGKGPVTLSAGSQPAPAGRILGHLDALYALAYFSSGDPESAQQAVIDAFTGVCTDPSAKSACRSRLWRTLADHVHLASDGRGASPAVGPAPFRDGALSQCQREAIALRLGGRRAGEAARLLGVSQGKLRREFRVGLEALYAGMVTDPARGYAPVVVRDNQRSPKR